MIFDRLNILDRLNKAILRSTRGPAGSSSSDASDLTMFSHGKWGRFQSMPVQVLVAGLALSLLSSMALPGPALSDDWPGFRGADRTAVSQDENLLDQWPESGPAVAWEVDFLGEGYGTPSIVGEQVFIQGTRGRDSVVWALEAATGKELWSVVLGERLIQDKGNGPRSTPTISEGIAYVVNGMGEVAALSAKDGKKLWQFNMLERFEVPNIRWGVSESPLVEGDWLILMPGGESGAIAALDKTTGKTVWTSKELTDTMSYASLVPVDLGGERVLLGFTQAAGVGVRAKDGKLLWSYKTPANAVANAAAPVFLDNKVFYTSSYGVGGGALQLKPGSGGVDTEELFFNPRLQNHHGGVVVYDGYLYGIFGAALSCVDMKTGEILWRNRSVGKGSVVAADGKLFLLGERHVVGMAKASPDGYEELGRFDIEDLGQPSWANPVVANGRFYVRNWNKMTVYTVAK